MILIIVVLTIINMYELLRNFVSREDFPRLIRILMGIHDGTLKNTCSVLVLTGERLSGISTLRLLLELLCGYSGKSPGRISPDYKKFSWRDTVKYQLSKDLVLHPDIFILKKIPEILNALHEDCNNFKFALQNSRGVMRSVGLVVVGYNIRSVDITRQHKIKTNPSDKRLPIYLHLPNTQKIGNYAILDCMTCDFYQLKETINYNIRHEAYWRYICRLSPVFKHLQKDLRKHMLSRYLITPIV